MKEDQNIEDLFRASFEQFEVTPPSSVKAAIDSEIQSGKRKRIWWISSVVLLLFLATGGWFLFGTSETETTSTKTTQLSSTKNQEGEEPVLESAPREAVHSTGEQPAAPSNSRSNSTINSTKSSQKSAVSATNKEQEIGITPKNKRPKSSSEYTNYKKKKKFTKKAKGKHSTVPSEKLIADENQAGTDTNPVDKKSPVDADQPVKIAGKSAISELYLPMAGKLSEKAAAQRKKESELAAAKADSNVVATNPSGTSDDDDKNVSTDKDWLVSVFAGPQWGINAVTKDPAFDFKEKTSLYFSAEINRNLFKGFGVTTGAGFNARTETMSYNQFSYDSVYVGTDSLPVYGEPNFPDSITGYTYIDNYAIDTTKIQQLQSNSVQSVAIPLFVTRHFSFSEQWGMLVNAGAVFRFNSFKTGNSGPAPMTNAFTVSPAIRVHLTYAKEKWLFSLGVSGGIDLKQAFVYDGFDRKRSYLTPQFGIHYRF